MEDESSLPALPHPLQTAMEYEAQFEHWETKFAQLCSSPSHPKWQTFVEGTKEVLVHSQLQEYELHIHQERRVEEQVRKVTKRKMVQKLGGLTARDA